MKKVTTLILACFIFTTTFGQVKRHIMIIVEPEFSQTLSDRTKSNNLYGLGLGLQAVLLTKSKFSPLLNITDDFIFLDDKVFRTNPDGSAQKSIQNVLKVFVGTNFNPTERIYLAMAAGPSFINGQTLLGIKPSIGFYFPETKRWTIKISYINILNRNSGKKENYSSLNFSIGLRLL